MSVGNAGVPESGSALSRSAAVVDGFSNGICKVRSTSKLSITGSSFSFSSYTSPPPQKKCKRLGCSTGGRSPLTEAFVYTSFAGGGGKRRGDPVGKTVSERADAPAIAMSIEHESNLDHLGEFKNVEGRCIPSECVTRHVREETRQHKTSDKVTQWLEDSCQSSVTGSALSPGSSVYSESETQHLIASPKAEQEDLENYPVQSSDLKPEGIAYASACMNISAGQLLSGIPFAMRPSNGRSTTKNCGIRYSIRSLKLGLCLPVVLLGFYLKTRFNSWEQYEPPPT